jgi:hypothetical protein
VSLLERSLASCEHVCVKYTGRYMPWGVPFPGATPYFRGPDQIHLHGQGRMEWQLLPAMPVVLSTCAGLAVRVRLTTGVPTHGRL